MITRCRPESSAIVHLAVIFLRPVSTLLSGRRQIQRLSKHHMPIMGASGLSMIAPNNYCCCCCYCCSPSSSSSSSSYLLLLLLFIIIIIIIIIIYYYYYYYYDLLLLLILSMLETLSSIHCSPSHHGLLMFTSSPRICMTAGS